MFLFAYSIASFVVLSSVPSLSSYRAHLQIRSISDTKPPLTLASSDSGVLPPIGLFLILVIVYMTAMGGPGAPTVWARNAIMIDFFATMGKPMTFMQWMYYGFLFVPVGAVVVGIYLHALFNRKLKLKINPGEHIKKEVRALGPYSGKQVTMTFILIAVILM